jgi:hypothetical protein
VQGGRAVQRTGTAARWSGWGGSGVEQTCGSRWRKRRQRRLLERTGQGSSRDTADARGTDRIFSPLDAFWCRDYDPTPAVAYGRGAGRSEEATTITFPPF